MSLISKVRNYDTFFSIKLKSKKPTTLKQYSIALADFDKFCQTSLDGTREEVIEDLKVSETEAIINAFIFITICLFQTLFDLELLDLLHQ